MDNLDLNKILYNFEVIDDTHIKINTTKEKLSNILKILLLNNINVYEIKKEIVSLEEIFLDATKEKYND